MKRLIFILTAAVLVLGCTKGKTYGEPIAPQGDVELSFSSTSNFVVDYGTRATADEFNGSIGILNSENTWEKAPSTISFAGLAGSSTVAKTLTTTPSTVAVPVGPYTFVACAISGNGRLSIASDSLVTLTGGVQTSDNDIVWATRSTSVVKPTTGSYAVKFDFAHVFSAIRFELTSGGVGNDEQLMSESQLTGVSNLGVYKNATMTIHNGQTGNFSSILGGGENIAWKTNYLVQPCTTIAGQIAILYHGVTYRGTLHALDLTPGRRTLVKITLQAATLTFEASVADWTEITDDSVILE